MSPSGPSSPSSNFQVYTRPPVSGSAPKLRDSCNACASSKIKCHKEKPICSGCIRRGLKCEYFASKRGGRLARSQNANHTRQRSENENSTAAAQAPAAAAAATWRGSSRTARSSTAPDAFFNDLALDPILTTTSTPAISASDPGSATIPASALSTSSTSPNLQVDYPLVPAGSATWSAITGLPETPSSYHDLDFSLLLEDCITDDPPFFLPGPFPLHPSFDNLHTLGGAEPLPTPEDVDDILETHEEPQLQSDKNSSLHQEVNKTDCYCLSSALLLMKTLTLKPPTSRCQNFGQATAADEAHSKEGQLQPTSLPTIEDVITKNQAAIESIGRMLNCSCAQDGYLLAQISLILLKILAWYDAAVRASRDTRPSPSDGGGKGSAASPRASSSDGHHSNVEQVQWGPTVVSSYNLDGEDSGRMAAQLVLSELSRVQRLVSGLEDAVRALLPLANTGQHARNGGNVVSMEVDDEHEVTPPASLLMLDGMLANIKKNLKDISIRIVKRLNSD